jgi:hypothetical protein
MKSSLFVLGTAAALLPLSALRAQTPFVETTTLTFFWGLTSDYVVNTETPVPTLPELVEPFDPDSLPVGVETFTDTLTPRAYTGPVTNTFPAALPNKQIIDLLLQRMVRNGKIFKEELGYRWQLTAVREAPRNVRELATNPYRVFLTAQYQASSSSFPVVEAVPYGEEIVTDDPLLPYYLDSSPDFFDTVTVDTGITITLGQHVGNYTESRWNGSDTAPLVLQATGSATTAFTVDFGALFYEDPKHALDKPENAPAFNYHLKRNYWQASASGYINYNVASIRAPLPTFVATRVTASATGWFAHYRSEVEYVNNAPRYKTIPITLTYGSAGIAPLRVTLSNVQYQKRQLFDLPLPATPIDLKATLVKTPFFKQAIVLRWKDRAFNETHYIVERRKAGSDTWEVLPRIESVGFGDGTTTVGDLEDETLYTFRLRAVNGAGSSEYSNEVEVTTEAASSE